MGIEGQRNPGQGTSGNPTPRVTPAETPLVTPRVTPVGKSPSEK
jgi:hypothetical protein